MELIESRRRILLSAPHVEATTPAGMANFQTDLIAPLKSCKVGFEPVQAGSGDPSPSNVRPISGWSGLTMYKAQGGLPVEYITGTTTSYGVTFTVDSSGKLTAEGTPTNISTVQYGYIDVNGNEVLYGRIYGNMPNVVFNKPALFDADGNFITTTLPDPALGNGIDLSQFPGVKRVRVVLKRLSNNVSMNGSCIVVVTNGSTPPAGTTIPVTFPAAGKNLFDADSVIRRDGYILNDNGTEQTSTISGYTQSLTRVAPGVQYTLSGTIVPPSDAWWRLYFYDDSKAFVSRTTSLAYADLPYTFTVPQGCSYIAIQYNIDAVQFDTVQLELGSTATSYEPFRNAYYGGYVDLVRGEVVATHGKTVLNGSESDWHWASSIPYVRITNMKSGTWYSDDGALCDSAKKVRNSYEGPLTCLIGYNDKYVYFYNVTTLSDVTDLQSFKTWLSTHNIALTYPLATPITYPLTPQIIKSLRGTNNIWSDANGDISVEYWKH